MSDPLFAGVNGPVPQGTRITLSFGFHAGYPGNAEQFHYGTDFGVFYIPLTAVPEESAVDRIGPYYGYGNVAVLRWVEDGILRFMLYAHCSRILVSVGQVVRRGDVIAISGATGFVFGAHLHLGYAEGFYPGAWRDAMPYLLKEDDVDEATTRRIAQEEAERAVEAYNAGHYANTHQFLQRWTNWGKQAPLMELIGNFFQRLARFAPGWPPPPDGGTEPTPDPVADGSVAPAIPDADNEGGD